VVRYSQRLCTTGSAAARPMGGRRLLLLPHGIGCWWIASVATEALVDVCDCQQIS
jgi:hypothetical protein